jgi:hypothetical protein
MMRTRYGVGIKNLRFHFTKRNTTSLFEKATPIGAAFHVAVQNFD